MGSCCTKVWEKEERRGGSCSDIGQMSREIRAVRLWQASDQVDRRGCPCGYIADEGPDQSIGPLIYQYAGRLAFDVEGLHTGV
jgi:hypothetical protein